VRARHLSPVPLSLPNISRATRRNATTNSGDATEGGRLEPGGWRRAPVAVGSFGRGRVVGTAGLNFHRVTKENLGDTDLLGQSGAHWASQCEAARLTY